MNAIIIWDDRDEICCPAAYRCRNCQQPVCMPHGTRTPDCPDGRDYCDECRAPNCDACWDREIEEHV